MAILRSVGARPRTILGLLMAEAGVLTLAGIALGVVLLYAALLVLQPYVDRAYGLHLPIDPPKPARAGHARRSSSWPAVWPGCCRRCAPIACRWPTA